MRSTAPPVGSYMTAAPHSIGRGQPLEAAHRIMRLYQIRHLPVLDGGRLVGVVSLGDLHLIETLHDVSPSDVSVEEAMTPNPYVVDAGAPLDEVAAHMGERKLGCALVVEKERVVGLFTTTDALRALADAFHPEASKPAPH